MSSSLKRLLCVNITMLLAMIFSIVLIGMGVQYTWEQQSFIHSSNCSVTTCSIMYSPPTFQQYLWYSLVNWDGQGLNHTDWPPVNYTKLSEIDSSMNITCPPIGSNITCYFDTRNIYYTLTLFRDTIHCETGLPLIVIASIIGGVSFLLVIYSVYLIYDRKRNPEETEPLL